MGALFPETAPCADCPSKSGLSSEQKALPRPRRTGEQTSIFSCGLPYHTNARVPALAALPALSTLTLLAGKRYPFSVREERGAYFSSAARIGQLAHGSVLDAAALTWFLAFLGVLRALLEISRQVFLVQRPLRGLHSIISWASNQAWASVYTISLSLGNPRTTLLQVAAPRNSR
jgi:hypothetical protein